ncbi:MAG TPA: F0F1 ATP synthase subunit epsilon [Streptosporangiaceae bacterium]
MTLHVRVVVPEGEVWAGDADRVIAKTLDGDIGVLTGHTPVLGILATGSVVRILPEAGSWIQAAVSGGFLSVADDKVSILARAAMLGTDVDTSSAREAISTAMVNGEDSEQVRYARARLRAAGEEA